MRRSSSSGVGLWGGCSIVDDRVVGSVGCQRPQKGGPVEVAARAVGVPGVDVDLRRGGVGGDDGDGRAALAGPRAEVVGRRGLVELADGPDQLVRIVGKAARRHAQPIGQKLSAEAANLLGPSIDEPLVEDGGGQGTVKGKAAAPEMGRALTANTSSTMTVVVFRRSARPAPTPGEKTTMRSVAAARRSLIAASRVKSRIACSFLGVPGPSREGVQMITRRPFRVPRRSISLPRKFRRSSSGPCSR